MCVAIWLTGPLSYTGFAAEKIGQRRFRTGLISIFLHVYRIIMYLRSTPRIRFTYPWALVGSWLQKLSKPHHSAAQVSYQEALLRFSCRMMAVQLRRASAKPLADAMHRQASDVRFVYHHSDFSADSYHPIIASWSLESLNETCWILLDINRNLSSPLTRCRGCGWTLQDRERSRRTSLGRDVLHNQVDHIFWSRWLYVDSSDKELQNT